MSTSSASSAPSVPPPPLLLTKHLTSFLSTLLSPHLHTALLCTPTGKLLAHVSLPLRPVPTLRTQATVAASLTTLYATAAPNLTPQDAEGEDDFNDGASRASDHTQTQMQTQTHRSHGDPPQAVTTPKTITVQLATGALIIRQLFSGLLLVCLGTPPPDSHNVPGTRPSSSHHNNTVTAPSISMALRSVASAAHLHPGTANGPLLGTLGSVARSLDDEGSVISAEGLTVASGMSTVSVGAGAVVGIKREVEEFAKRLEGRLTGLNVPNERFFDH